MPLIVYLQTVTACNGHCGYCPFDDIYNGRQVEEMSFNCYKTIIEWLKSNDYKGRIGYLLHYEPTLDPRIPQWIDYAKEMLPNVSIEVATNGIIKTSFFEKADNVYCVLAGSKKIATSRAGNCKSTPQTIHRLRLTQPPCRVPIQTMPIAANGDVLLCCQDWRHEAVVGTYEDLSTARRHQLSLMKKVTNMKLEICHDCMSGKTSEEVGERLGKRFI